MVNEQEDQEQDGITQLPDIWRYWKWTQATAKETARTAARFATRCYLDDDDD